MNGCSCERTWEVGRKRQPSRTVNEMKEGWTYPDDVSRRKMAHYKRKRKMVEGLRTGQDLVERKDWDDHGLSPDWTGFAGGY